MAKKPEGTSAGDLSSGLFADRDKLTGNNSGVDAMGVDAMLLWHVVVLLAERRASIQIGVTRDGSSWSVQYWDGKAPVKEYFTSTRDLNSAWAALIRAAYRREVPEEVLPVVEAYGW